MGRLIRWIKTHKILAIFILLCIFVGPLLLIRFFYLIAMFYGADNSTLEWITADLLEYIALSLTLIGTLCLSVLAVWQNYEYGRRSEALEEKVLKWQQDVQERADKKLVPRFFITWQGDLDTFQSLIVHVQNISEATISNFTITRTFCGDKNGSYDHNYLSIPTIPIVLLPNAEPIKILLVNKPRMDKFIYIGFNFKCIDIFGDLHSFEAKIDIQGITYTGSAFSIKEI